MDLDVSPLFQPLQVKNKLFRNRIVMPPMVQLRKITSPEGIGWYRERARGVALVIVEATAVNRFGAELTVSHLRPLVDAIHEGGALAAIQLFPVTFDFPRTTPLPTPADLTLDDIAVIVRNYRLATEICSEAGFDGVEPHGAHNYLINQCFSPEQNTRTDAYGGSLENRMRFALGIVRTMRHVAEKAEMLLLYRHTPVGKGYGFSDSVRFVQYLIRDGVDVLDISPASADAPGDRSAPFTGLGVPVIAVNRMDEPERALEVLREKRADLIAVGRGLIADPEWVQKVRNGRFGDIIRCMRCDEGCHGHLKLGIPVTCVEWPAGF